MAVAEGEGRPRHPGIFRLVPQQIGDGGEDSFRIGADQLEIAGGQRFGPLGDLAQHQHRPAERRRLFPLPPLLLGSGAADWPDILAGLRITGHFLARDVLIERQAGILAGRERLLDRLKRAGG